MTESLIAQTVQNEPANYLTELVGEGKKFQTTEDLAKGKWISDTYVKTLERQLDEARNDIVSFRKEADTKANLQELVTKIESMQKQPTNSNEPHANVETQRPVIDPKDIESLVMNKLNDVRNAEKQEINFKMVQNKLNERFGAKAGEVIKQHIDTLGISEARLNEMARTEPQVLIRALGLDAPAPQSSDNLPRSSVRSDSFTPSVGAKRTWSYYQKLKKENPSLYYDPKTNIAIHNDMIQLGKEFEDGDFHKYG